MEIGFGLGCRERLFIEPEQGDVACEVTATCGRTTIGLAQPRAIATRPVTAIQHRCSLGLAVDEQLDLAAGHVDDADHLDKFAGGVGKQGGQIDGDLVWCGAIGAGGEDQGAVAQVDTGAIGGASGLEQHLGAGGGIGPEPEFDAGRSVRRIAGKGFQSTHGRPADTAELVGAGDAGVGGGGGIGVGDIGAEIADRPVEPRVAVVVVPGGVAIVGGGEIEGGTGHRILRRGQDVVAQHVAGENGVFCARQAVVDGLGREVIDSDVGALGVDAEGGGSTGRPCGEILDLYVVGIEEAVHTA